MRLKNTSPNMTLEDIAYAKSLKYGYKQVFNTRLKNAQDHFYEGFIAGFTYKFTGGIEK